MKQKHGIADARKIAMVGLTDETSVVVTDGDGYVALSIGSQTYPCGMTPEQARFIAAALIASAERVEQ